MKQLLRTIDGWRFEAPLALLLGVAAGFATLAMPHRTFGHVPVAGGLGDAGQMGLALLVALVAGGLGYVAMRGAGKPGTVAAPDPDLEIEEEPEPVDPGRLRRVRRADAHPDAPPRAPIIASRDLGEPFMDVGAVAAPRAEPAPVIPDGEYVEVGSADAADADPVSDETVTEFAAVQRPVVAPFPEEGVEWSDPVPMAEAEAETIPDPVAAAEDHAALEAAPIETIEAADTLAEVAPREASAHPEATEDAAPEPDVTHPVSEALAPVAQSAGPEPEAIALPDTTAPGRRRESLAAMMDRLSAGLERRAAEPVSVTGTPPERDMRPALRDALEELNRIASARRG